MLRTQRRGVFVNYRVGDRQNEAALIADGLVRRLGADEVFFASRSLPLGQNFEVGLLSGVRGCEVVLAVIGPNWLTTKRGDGTRAIDDPQDWVRREIAEALRLGIPIVPVLVGDRTPISMPRAADLPAEIAALSRMQYLRLHYQDISLDRLVGRLLEVSPGLAVTALFAPAHQIPDGWSPSMLLRAEYEIVPFHGRDRELADLHEWCAHQAPMAARVMTGPGGQGKTRLAQTMCQTYRARGWVAGFVADRATPEGLRRIGELAAPLLVVFDYAEARANQVMAVAEAMTGRPDRGHPVRLLLLARAPGEWQRPLAEHGSDAISALFRSMTEVRLTPLAAELADKGGRRDLDTVRLADRGRGPRASPSDRGVR